MAEVSVKQFSGGLTDFLQGAPLGEFDEGDNLLVTRNAKLYTRPGSRLVDAANPQLPTGNQRVASLWNFDENTALLGHSARRAFRYSAGWPELLGPTSNPFFSAGAATAHATGSDWKGHLFLTNDEGALPMKLYRDQSGTYQSVTAGLPKFLAPDAYSATTVVTAAFRDLANDLKAKFLAHYADTGLHTTAADTVSAALLTAANLTAGDSMAVAMNFVGQLTSAYMSHYRDAVAKTDTRAYHSNALGDAPGEPNIQLVSLETPTTWKGLSALLNELKFKYNAHTRGFNIHPSSGTLVAVADLASTDYGPLSSSIVPQSALDLANAIKAAYNHHVSTNNSHNDQIGSESTTSPVAFALLKDSSITLADATDKNSWIELSLQIIARYKAHQLDAATVVLALSAASGTTTPNKLFNTEGQTVASLTGSPPLHGATEILTYNFISDKNYDQFLDWYVGFCTGDSADYGKNFTRGTTITVVPLVTDAQKDYTVSTNNDGSIADGVEKAFFIAKKKFHTVNSNQETFTGMTPADYDYNSLAQDTEALFAALLATATNLNTHMRGQKIHTISGAAIFVDTSLYPNAYQDYQYAFVWARTYTIFTGETFKDISSPLVANYQVYRDEAISSITFTGLPTLANGATGNYDTVNTVIEIYRSTDSGTTLYKVGEVPNGTTTFTDNVSDTDLLLGEKLYTSGGVLDNDPPPKCKAMHIMQNGIAYYGDVTRTLDDGTVERIPQRINQAVQDDPDSVPAGNLVDLPLAFAGISSVRTIPIAWTAEATYRLEGTFNELGQGSIRAVTISDRVGLKGSFSPVQVDGAVVFAGPDQFYMTDGYNLIPLGTKWPTTYATITSTQAKANNIVGCYDKLSNHAFWGAGRTGAENDSWFALNLEFPPTGSQGLFTTASNGTSFAPTSLCFFNGQLIRGDSRGYVFKHDASYTSDSRVDLLATPSAWFTKTIIYNYTSAGMNFGTSLLRKWGSLIEMKFENLGNLSLQPISINDFGRNMQNLAKLRIRNVVGGIDEKRYFSAGGIYFSDKQIKMTNAFVDITNSDTLGVATVTGGTTITGTFPSDMVDHVIAFEVDGYTAEHVITDQTGTTILASTGLTNGANQKWVIRGYPKTERMQLNEYTIYAIPMGSTQSDAGGESGANA